MLRKDKALLESLTRKYGKKNLLNEMSIESFNTRVAKDFVAMVLQYVKDEPDTVVNGEFNYGEYADWVDNYPELCELCMVGDNHISDAADELVDALFNFIRVAQRNTITSTYRRELENKDVEVVDEGVDYKKALKNLKKLEDLKNKKENAISNLGKGDYNEEIEILLDNAKESIFGDLYIDYNFYSNPDLLYALLQSGKFYNPIIYIDFNNRTQTFNLKDNKLASAIYNVCVGSGYNNVDVKFNSNLDVVKISANKKYKK